MFIRAYIYILSSLNNHFKILVTLTVVICLHMGKYCFVISCIFLLLLLDEE